MTRPLRTEAEVIRRSRAFDIHPDLICIACGRVAMGVNQHFGHRVTRLAELIAPPAPPAPRIKDDVLTVHAIAADLGVSKMTVYRLIHSGELRAMRIGRSFRVRESDLRDYLAGTPVVRLIVGEG